MDDVGSTRFWATRTEAGNVQLTAGLALVLMVLLVLTFVLWYEGT